MLLFSPHAIRPLLVPSSFPWSQTLRRLAPLPHALPRRHLAAVAGGVVAIGLLRIVLVREARPEIEPEWLMRPALSGAATGFEVNAGQAARDVQFVAQGQGVKVLVLPGELRLAAEAGRHSSVRLRLEGAAPQARLVTDDLQPEERHYRMSPLDESVVTASSYGAVGYRALYPGVDLWLKLDPNRLRLRFRIDRGASAAPIRLSIDGAAASRDGNGVALGTSGLRIDDADVRAYQGDGARRQPVTAVLESVEDRSIGLKLGAHDVRRPVDVVVTVRVAPAPAAGGQTLAMAQ